MSRQMFYDNNRHTLRKQQQHSKQSRKLLAEFDETNPSVMGTTAQQTFKHQTMTSSSRFTLKSPKTPGQQTPAHGHKRPVSGFVPSYIKRCRSASSPRRPPQPDVETALIKFNTKMQSAVVRVESARNSRIGKY